jgi:hypothetical protein
MKMLVTLAIAAALGSAGAAPFFTTYNEPWHEDVLRAAIAFVEIEVTTVDASGFEARVLKQLAGERVPDHIKVNGYAMLEVESVFDHGDGNVDPELAFHFAPGEHCYLFLHRMKTEDVTAPADTFQIATPSAGFADVQASGVRATYRFSAHQAIVPVDLYEPSMAALFRKLHGTATAEDAAFVRKLIDTELHKAPQDVGQGDDATFFRQHVALECSRFFGTEQDLPLLDPFLASASFHVQVSAVRAVAGIHSEQAQARLIDFLGADHAAFAKALAIWGLRDQDARALAPRLEAMLGTMSTEKFGFGLNIMDPRVGTKFPETPRQALEQLLDGWKQPN